MGFRITTSMMMNTYKYNLSNSTARMDSARNMVLTGRQFDSYAEDPASAAHEWRIRRAITRNAGYITSNSEAYSRINTAWATLASIDDNLLNYDGGALDAIKRADNEPTGGARQALGTVLDNLAKSVIYSLNGAKYGDHFLFSGNDEMNAPFSWDGDKLLYRGIPVDAGGVPSLSKPPSWAESKPIPINTPYVGRGFNEQAWVDYYRNGGANPLTAEPEWVNEYVDWMKATENWLKDPENNPEPAGHPPYIERQEGGTALEDLWATLLSKNGPDVDLDEVRQQIADNMPSWAEGDPLLVPEDMPLIENASSDWERAWIAYYMLDGPNNGDIKYPSAIVDDMGWDLEDPSTWPERPVIEAPPEPKYNEKGDLENEKEFEDYCAQYYNNNTYDFVAAAWLEYAYDQQNYRALQRMSDEVKNMDVGMGLQEATGNRDLLQTTAFDRSIPGINVLGYGVDEDGDPKNLVSIMKRLAELYSKCDEDGRWYLPGTNEKGERVIDEETTNEVYRLLDKFNAAHERFNKAYSDVDTRGDYLLSNAERLTSQNVTLQEQLYDVSRIDEALAIEEFSYSYYAYSAALKIGTQLLSQSLIDYMS